MKLAENADPAFLMQKILKHMPEYLSQIWESLLLDQAKCRGKLNLINVLYLDSGEAMQYEVLVKKLEFE